jgi:hypothetical protein
MTFPRVWVGVVVVLLLEVRVLREDPPEFGVGFEGVMVLEEAL